MAPAAEDDTKPRSDVFSRLLQLPVVSATREVLQNTYSSTKQTHPLICAVCGFYERGARKAGNLAVWTIQPAVHRLEPQISAVNLLACKGLDQLEDKIPALQYPPEKLAAGIAEMVSSTVQSAREGISRPIGSTSDRALGVASSGYQLTWRAMSSGMNYVLNSTPVRLAAEGADAALTLTEHLINYFLPPSEEEMEKDACWQPESEAPQTSYKRLGALTVTACQRAYSRAANRIQHTGVQGRDLALNIPGMSPLLPELNTDDKAGSGLSSGPHSPASNVGTVEQKGHAGIPASERRPVQLQQPVLQGGIHTTATMHEVAKKE